MTEERPGYLRLEDAYLEDTAAGLREVLRVARALGRISEEAELLDLVNTTTREKLGCKVCAIAMRGDDGAYRYSAASGLSLKEDRALRRRVLSQSAFEALRDAAVSIGAVWLVPPGDPVRERSDVIAGTLLAGRAAAPRSRQSDPLLFAPLIGADGEPVGLMHPADPLHDDFPTSREALLLETLAELTVVGLEIVRARVLEHAAVVVAEAQRRQLEDLLAASAQVRGYYSLDEVLSEIARAMTTAGGFGRAAIYLRLPDDSLEVRATIGLSEVDAEQLRASAVTVEEFAPIMRPEMLVSRSYLFDHRRFQLPQELNQKLNTPTVEREWAEGQWHPEDMLTVKIADVDGELLGLISVDEPLNGLLPDRAHVQAIEFFADQCAVAVAHARRYEQVRAEALTDPLTGLANRRALDAAVVRAIGRARREAALCAVLFIDIDHFKDINDSLGHAVGDAVLQRVGRALRDRLRRGDLLARYGGEEFVALLPDTDLEAATRVAEVLRRRVATIDFGSWTGTLPVRVSIGVAQLSEKLMGAGSLVSAADAAMYEAKRQGRNRVVAAT
ncbi:MAG: diguanylate cyclase [Acidimicrobiales bacterium]|jgi:diguanylate cyclase (GGDEF)-like protein